MPMFIRNNGGSADQSSSNKKKILLMGKTTRISTEGPKPFILGGYEVDSLYLDINASQGKNGEEFVAENYLQYDLIVVSFLQEATDAATPAYLQNQLREWYYTHKKPLMETMVFSSDGRRHQHNIGCALGLFTETLVRGGHSRGTKTGTSKFLRDATSFAPFVMADTLSPTSTFGFFVDTSKPYIGTIECLADASSTEAAVVLVDRGLNSLTSQVTQARFASYGSYYSTGNIIPSFYVTQHFLQVVNWLLK
jgi:hypothetical protein